MTSTAMAYRVGWLIDGTGKPAVENRIVTIDGSRFQAILAPSDPQPAGMTIVDLSHCTVLPALIDSHVHLVMSGSTEPSIRQAQLKGVYKDRLEAIGEHLRQHLACGVLAVRDGGDHNGDTLRYKRDTAGHPPTVVTIASAGRARNAPGRYGNLIGIPVEAGMTLAQSAFGSEPQRDHLKLVNSGLNSLTQFGVETQPQFNANELATAVAAARRHGQPTMVHANGYLPVKLAVDAGCASIEHGFFMGRENLGRMADHGVVWVPTAVTMKAYGDYLKGQGHRRDASFAEVSLKNLEHQLDANRHCPPTGGDHCRGNRRRQPGGSSRPFVESGNSAACRRRIQRRGCHSMCQPKWGITHGTA